MKFDQFLLENMDIEIDKNIMYMTPDEQCIDACWSIIEQQCGGDAKTLTDYLAKEVDVPSPTAKDIIIYVMELVDDYLNNNITISKGKQYIKHGKRKEFVKSMMKIEYNVVVENLLRKLFKVKDDDTDPPSFVKDIFKIMDDCLYNWKKKSKEFWNG